MKRSHGPWSISSYTKVRKAGCTFDSSAAYFLLTLRLHDRLLSPWGECLGGSGDRRAVIGAFFHVLLLSCLPCLHDVFAESYALKNGNLCFVARDSRPSPKFLRLEAMDELHRGIRRAWRVMAVVLGRESPFFGARAVGLYSSFSRRERCSCSW